MKSVTRYLILSPVIICGLWLASCQKESDPYADNTYLLSSKKEVIMTKENIITLLNVISTAYPGVADIKDDVQSGVIVYSVTYNTTFKGEDVIASGIVAIPTTPGIYPILSYQNGTNTLHSEAPSVNPFNTYFQMLQCVASTGYVVVIADYLGFGAAEGMAHPYLHKASTVQTLTDLLYAVGEFDEDVAKDIHISNELYLQGYSQGGWATLALFESLNNSNNTDYDVKAVSCGAGPYDMDYFNSYILGQTTYPMPVFLGYIANAYTEYDLFTNPLTDIVKEPYAGRIPGLYDGLHTSDAINLQLTTSIPGLFTASYLTGYATAPAYQSVRDAMKANSVAAWDCDIPLLFIHGASDTYVIPELSSRMYNAMLTKGSDPIRCTYLLLPGLDHTGGIVPAGLASLEFFKTMR